MRSLLPLIAATLLLAAGAAPRAEAAGCPGPDPAASTAETWTVMTCRSGTTYVQARRHLSRSSATVRALTGAADELGALSGCAQAIATGTPAPAGACTASMFPGGQLPCDVLWPYCLESDTVDGVVLQALEQTVRSVEEQVGEIEATVPSAVRAAQTVLQIAQQLLAQLQQDVAGDAWTSAAAPGPLVVTLADANRPLDAGMARLGAYAARRELGVQSTGVVVTSRTAARALTRPAPLVVAVGAPLLQAVRAAARRAPDTTFVVVGEGLGRRAAGPANVRTIGFDERSAGRVAGYAAAAGLPGDRRSVLSVLRRPGRAADGRYAAGFRAGARAARPRARVLTAFPATLRACAASAASHARLGARVGLVLGGEACAAAAARTPGLQTIATARSGTAGELATVIERVDLAVFGVLARLHAGTAQPAAELLGLPDGIGVASRGPGAAFADAAVRVVLARVPATPAVLTRP